MFYCVTDVDGSGHSKKASKCGNCKFGAECDEDSEDVLLVYSLTVTHIHTHRHMHTPRQTHTDGVVPCLPFIVIVEEFK